MRTMLEIVKAYKSRHRKSILVIADVTLISACYLFTWSTLMGWGSWNLYLPMTIISWGVYVVIFCVIFWCFGMYESLWRYAEAHEFFKCCLATVISAVFFVTSIPHILKPPFVEYRAPVSVYLLAAIISGISTLFMRMAYRVYRTTAQGGKLSSNAQKTMIVGAGYTANQIIQDISRAKESKYNVVCLVDDDPDKLTRTIQKVRVSGTCDDIPRLVEKHGIKVIILAIPSVKDKERRRIVNICAKTKCQLKKVPDLYEFVTDTTDIISQLHNVSVEDLLGRETVEMSRDAAAYLCNKVVMVTGGGGSIGSELCRQIAAQRPKQLIIVDIYENNAYEIQQELVYKYKNHLDLHTEIASVRDEEKIEVLFKKYSPQVVYHAAAHKHVPLMETAPEEAVKNNIFGTLNMARCADKFGVKRFVMISTDKAVNPTNVMGATKRACEMIVQSMDKVSKTEFVAVRFGNVLGSNGSVIPLFKHQIEAGGPVTVTDPQIIRYFMTIPEAVCLVLTAGEIAKGGEIFVLDMGEPVRILDLAENLIRLSGLEPYKDIKIEFSGLRPGEKLFEELLMGEEGLRKTNNRKIFVGTAIDVLPDYLFAFLEDFKPIAYSNNPEAVLKKLHELVPTFIVKSSQREALKI